MFKCKVKKKKLKQTLNESVQNDERSTEFKFVEQLCKEMDQYLLHCEVCWLSEGKVLSYFLSLGDKLKLFLVEKQFHLSDLLADFLV